MNKPFSDVVARQELISAGVTLWNNAIQPTLRAALDETGISESVAHRIFGGTVRGVDSEYQHQVEAAALSQPLEALAGIQMIDPAGDVELATEAEMTSYLAATIEQAASQIEAWALTDTGRAYIAALTSDSEPDPDSAFARFSDVVVDAVADYLSDVLQAFGLMLTDGTTLHHLSASIIALVNDHLVDPPETIEITTSSRNWSPLGFALARHFANRTQTDPNVSASAQPANLNPRSRPVPTNQPQETIAFTGQLSYVLSGLIGEHLTVSTVDDRHLDVRLTGYTEDPYTLIGQMGTDELEVPIAQVAVARIHPHS